MSHLSCWQLGCVVGKLQTWLLLHDVMWWSQYLPYDCKKGRTWKEGLPTPSKCTSRCRASYNIQFHSLLFLIDTYQLHICGGYMCAVITSRELVFPVLGGIFKLLSSSFLRYIINCKTIWSFLKILDFSDSLEIQGHRQQNIIICKETQEPPRKVGHEHLLTPGLLHQMLLKWPHILPINHLFQQLQTNMKLLDPQI